MATVCIAGSTGLTGSQILSTLLAQPDISKVYAYTRRDLPAHVKQTELRSADTTTWASLYPKEATVFFSGLGTTRAAAGGFANQYKIDYDLNLELAKAAKAAGTKVYVLISSAGSNATSMVPYSKMKGQLEEAVKALDFDHCIIMRPGLLVGRRTESRTAEGLLQGIARFAGSMRGSLKDFWAQDVETVARAAVAASREAIAGDRRRIRLVEQAEIVRLGRTEWK